MIVQSPQGVLEVQYMDDTQLSVLPKEQGGGFIFRGDGVPMRYTAHDALPELVRARLEQIPIVLKHMAQSDVATAAFSSTPVSSRRPTAMRFCR